MDEYDIDCLGTEDEIIQHEARKARARYRDRGAFAGSSEASQIACWIEAVAPLVRIILAFVVAMGAKSVREALARAKAVFAPMDVEAELGALAEDAHRTGPRRDLEGWRSLFRPLVTDRARLAREVERLRRDIAADGKAFDKVNADRMRALGDVAKLTDALGNVEGANILNRNALKQAHAEIARLTSDLDTLAADVGQALCAATLRPGETITDQRPHAIVSLVVGLVAQKHAQAAEIARLTVARDNLQAEVSMLVGGLNDIFGEGAHPSPREALEQVSGLVRRLRTAAPGEAWERLCNAVGCLRGWPDEGIADAVKAFDAYRAAFEPRVDTIAADPSAPVEPTVTRLEYTATASTAQPVTVELEPLTEDEKREAHRFGKVTGIGFARAQEAIAETKAKRAAERREVITSAPEAEPIDAEDLWTDYRTERPHLTASDRLAFLEGVAAARRTASPPRALTEAEAREDLAQQIRSLSDEQKVALAPMFAEALDMRAIGTCLNPICSQDTGHVGECDEDGPFRRPASSASGGDVPPEVRPVPAADPLVRSDAGSDMTKREFIAHEAREMAVTTGEEPRIASREARYAAVMKHHERIQAGLGRDETDPPTGVPSIAGPAGLDAGGGPPPGYWDKGGAVERQSGGAQCAAVLVTDPAERVLLVLSSKGGDRGWQLPGGKLDPGEDPRAGARREVIEETGLAVVLSTDEPAVLPATERHRGALLFRGRADGEPTPGSDALEAMWFSTADVLWLDAHHELSELASRDVLLEWARRPLPSLRGQMATSALDRPAASSRPRVGAWIAWEPAHGASIYDDHGQVVASAWEAPDGWRWSANRPHLAPVQCSVPVSREEAESAAVIVLETWADVSAARGAQ